MNSENSLRVIGYVRRAEISGRIAELADRVGLIVEELDRLTRISIPIHVLDAEGSERVADLVVKILGADEAPRHQLIVQPNSRRHEVSITLFDLKDRPSRVIVSEMVCVRKIVAEFIRAEVI